VSRNLLADEEERRADAVRGQHPRHRRSTPRDAARRRR
jgi:hypothetical protein